MSCKTCKYFKESELNGQLQRQFICTRFPPTSQLIPTGPTSAQIMTVWPNVQENNECGEFNHAPHLKVVV